MKADVPIAAAAAKEVPRVIPEKELPGSFGMPPGIYTISDQGMWVRVSP